MARIRQDGPLSRVPSHERHFYSVTQAFGRFGMRLFEPQRMDAPHWHGHVEANFLTAASMVYSVDDEELIVPRDRLVIFWAGIPHQLTEIRPAGDDTPRLANIYIPVDAFLFLPHITELQVQLFGGAVAVLPSGICSEEQIQRWYADYRANDFERLELMKMELNALLRRAQLTGIDYLRAPTAGGGEGREITSAQNGYVVAMLRYVLENLTEPMTNADVTAVTGLHENYALSIFARTMRVPLRRFIIRMRLMRARALLVESSMAIASAAEASGFTSVSQFYSHFKTAYGISPHLLRSKYKQMALR
jgi:AraC-like DNA-binding protein